MMGPSGFCLLTVLLITTFEDAKSATSYPLEGCSPVKKLDGTGVIGATLTSPASTPGPYNYEALAFTNPDSKLEIPQNASGLGDTIRTIAFNVKLNSYNQNKVLFTILNGAGKGVEVKQYGNKLIITTTFPSGTVLGAVPNVTTTYTRTQLANNWNAIKLTVNMGEGIFIKNQYGAALNGAILKDESNRYEDFSNGNIVVDSFDGALSCMTLSDQTDGTASLLSKTACTNYAPTCPVTRATTTTTSATTSTATRIVSTTARPDHMVDPVPPCICDVDETSICQTLTFTGTGFAQGDTYVCNIQYHELNATGELVATTNEAIPAVFVSEEEVTCSLSSAISAEVTLVWTERELVLATAKALFVPTLCFDCLEDFSCQATGKGCYIDGKCIPPYTFVGDHHNQTCVPDINPVGPSPIPSLRGKLKSCGQAQGFEVSETSNGFTTTELAVAAASFAINFKFISRLPCSTNKKVILAELAPGIKLYQLDSKVIMEIAFVDPSTGAKNVKTKKFNVEKENFKDTLDLLLKESQRKKRNNSGGFCGVGLFFRHIPATGETSLTDLKNKRIEFGDTKNLQIFTTGQAMISKRVRACFQINSSPAEKYKYTRNSSGCYSHVWRTNENCNI